MAVNFSLEFQCPKAASDTMIDGKFHCLQCDKTVFDARNWSKQEISFRLKQAGGSLCLNLDAKQLEEPAEVALMRVMPRPLRFWEIFALGLLFCFGLQVNTFGQSSTPTSRESIASAYEQVCTGELEAFRYGGAIVRLPDTLKYPRTKIVHEDGREIIILTERIFFKSGAASFPLDSILGVNTEITPEPLDVLFGSMEVILDFPWKVIELHGHADPNEKGDKVALSKARAEFIAAEFRKWGIKNEIVIKAYGTSAPDTDLPHKDYEGRDRTVRIVLMEPEE